MKYFIILSSCMLAVLGKPQSTPQYGVPSNLRTRGGSSRGFAISNTANTIRNNEQQRFNLQSNDNTNNGGSFGDYDNGGNSALNGGSLPDGPKVYKHISIHVPPQEESEAPTMRVIRPMMAPDKHVNIIFVKAPSSSSAQQTEVILPEEPQRKTIVYILVKKRESQNEIKIRQPAPTQPPKPQVFFIRYKKGSGVSGGSGNPIVGQLVVKGGQLSGVGGGKGLNSRPEYGVPSNLE